MPILRRLTAPIYPLVAAVVLPGFFPAPSRGQFPPQPPTVTIVPHSDTIPVGDTLPLTAVVVGSDGDTLDARVRWESLDPEVARVTREGGVSPRLLEEARIVARFSGAADTAVVMGGAALAENAFPVDSMVLDLVSDSVDHMEGVLRFELAPDAERPAIDSGTVLVGAQGEGFLRRVESVEWEHGHLEVTTTEAALTDVLVAGRFDLEIRLIQPCVEMGCDEPVSRAAGGRSLALASAPVPGGVGSPSQAGRSCSYGWPARRTEFRCGPTVRLRESPSARFTASGLELQQEFRVGPLEMELVETLRLDPEARLSYRVNKLFGVPREVEYVRVGFEASADGSAEGTVEVHGGLPPRRDSVKLASFTRPFVATPGFPVKGRVTASFYAGYVAEAEAEGVLRSGRQWIHADLAASMEWDGRWSSSGPSATITPDRDSVPAPEGGVDTTVRLFVRPEISIILYGTAGPEAAVVPYLEGQATVERRGGTCSGRTELAAGVDSWTGVAWSPVAQRAADILGVGRAGPWEGPGGRTAIGTGEGPCSPILPAPASSAAGVTSP